MSRKKRRSSPLRRPLLYVSQILAWADEHRRRTGAWPTLKSGPIQGAPGETWGNVSGALHRGNRGLRPGSSLARLLAEHRGVRNRKALPPFQIAQILSWADAHHRRRGSWPTMHGGPIHDAPGETWTAVDSALRSGIRGLPAGGSLAELLETNRGVRNTANLPPLSAERILAWADAHHRRTGHWPQKDSGPIEDALGETWMAVDSALRQGTRGFSGGYSLPRLLAEHRGQRNKKGLPRLTYPRILEWADAHYRRTGARPTLNSGPILDAPGETWSAVDGALAKGYRGLPPGSSLARLLQGFGRTE